MKASSKQQFPTFEYKARASEYVEKSKDWFWVLWIIVVASVAAAALRGNFSFAAFLFLAGLILTVLAIRKPPIVSVLFENSFVQIDNKKYAVSDIESYNFIPEDHRLLLKHKKPYVPIIIVPLGTQGPEGKVRGYINASPWIEDIELQEPFLELVAEKIGI